MTTSLTDQLRGTRLGETGRNLRNRLRLAIGGRRLRQSGFDSRIVWVMGSPRSGSTWLMRLLAERPAVKALDEPLIGDHLGPFLCDRHGVSPENLDFSDFTLMKARGGSDDYFFSQKYANVWTPLLGDLIRGRFAAQFVDHPPEGPLRKAYLVVKEPHGSQSAEAIMSSLPGSRLIFLIRDGRDVVDSDLASSQRGSWVQETFPAFTGVDESVRLAYITQSAHKWLWRTEAVQAAYAKHPGPKLLVRYENLRADPGDELARIFDWLGIQIEEPELASLVERHSFERLPVDERGPLKSTRTAQPGLWRENLGPHEQSILDDVLGEKLHELGYEVADASGVRGSAGSSRFRTG